MAYCKVK